MENIVNFLLDNYIYIVFVVILLVLALIGYMVDIGREERMKKKLLNIDDNSVNIPNININEIDPNVTINDSMKTEVSTEDKNVN